MRAVLLSLVLILASCSRPLTENEAAFIGDLKGDTLDTEKVRIIRDVPLSVSRGRRDVRPRLACRERILPPPTGETVTVSTAAAVLGSTVYVAEDWYTEDYLKGYPDRIHLVAAMLFAHEMNHVWQWQNRRDTGYSPWKSVGEHGQLDDPYLFDISTKNDFLDYRFEQQASIVEEYVCCAVLDPQAPRTKRIRHLLQGAFPLDGLPQPKDVILPWEDAKTRGICRK